MNFSKNKIVILSLGSFLVFGSLPAMGVMNIGGSGSSSSGTVTPGNVSPPSIIVDDNDRSDDEIIQLNNLRIQEIKKVGNDWIISAISDFGGACNKFEASGRTLPCPMAPSILHQIKVKAETILLLRTRARAQISAFQPGDMINVYGFRDMETGLIEALILRNLDKPQIEKFIQLNEVEVIVPPTSLALPTTIGVARKNLNPCYDYGQYGNSKMMIYPCPMGVESFVNPTLKAKEAEVKTVVPDSVSYPGIIFKKYEIKITAKTVLLDANKKKIALSRIETGDRLNIYGVLKKDGTIEARTVRNLTKPAPIPVGNLRITTNSNLTGEAGKYFIAAFRVSGGDASSPYVISTEGSSHIPGLNWTRTAPCPENLACIQVEQNDTIYLHGVPTKSGKYLVNIVAQDNPHPIYCITAPCPQPTPRYGKAQFGVVINGDAPIGQALSINSFSGPSILKVGEVGKWNIEVISPNTFLNYRISWGDEIYYPNSEAKDMALSPPIMPGNSAAFTHAYNSPGTYVVRVVVTDDRGNSSTAEMKILVQ